MEATSPNLNNDLVIRIQEAAARLKAELQWDQLPAKPKAAVVLGSGLGIFADQLTQRRVIPYKKIPHMKESAVPGHAGQWVYGFSGKTPVLAAQGRVHFYEGYPLWLTTIHIRIMKALGIQHVILSNAAGSVNPDYQPGDFMLLEDHLNLMFQSPLRGLYAEELGPRFVDMSEPYCKKTNGMIQTRVQKNKPEIRLHRGTYAVLSGPQYETPAEIQCLYKLGADAVGMSTVPETIVARQCGLTVTGISCITNLGSGLSGNKLEHQEVMDVGRQSAPRFSWLLEELLKIL